MLLKKQFSPSRELNSIKPQLQEIRNDYSPRLLESLQSIMSFFLGSPQIAGVLHRFGKQFANYEPLEWAAQLQKLLQHIVPGSPAFTQIQKRNRDPNAQIIIPTSYLPHYVDANSFDRSKLIALRATHSGLSLPPLDAFYLMLAHAIYETQSITPPTTQFDHLFLDEFYSSLSRNPLLILLRKNLQYFSIRDRSISQKIVYLLRMFLIDEVLIKYEQDHNKNAFNTNNPYSQEPQRILNQSSQSVSSLSLNLGRKSIQLRYRMKVHHVHTIFLILKYLPEPIQNDFPKYCQAMFQYFGSLKPDQFCLQALIRLWIYGMTLRNDSNIENDVIKMLENANSKQGWFYLKRYLPTEIRTSENISLFNIQTSISIIRLFQRDQNWLPNSSYLFTLACLFHFLNRSRVYFNQLSSSRKSMGTEGRENNVNLLQKILRSIVIRYNQNLIDILSKIKKNKPEQYEESLKLIRIYEHLIEEYYSEYFKTKDQQKQHIKMHENNHLPQDFKFREIQDSDVNSSEKNNIATTDPIEKIDSEAKRKLVVFYRKQPRGCWEVPIQYNESVILFYLFFIIAKVVDLLIPGRRSREYPLLNLRFLANPITFIVTIVAILILVHIFR